MRRSILALLLSLACVQACHAQEQVFVPVPQSSAANEPILLETFIYRPAGEGRFPLVIISHGSSGGTPKASQKWDRTAKVFTDKGFVVLAPMRRGRGQSTGISLESEDKNCDVTSWDAGLEAAMKDISATNDFASSQPFINTENIVLAGVSRGGFLSVAYAAEGDYKSKLAGVINFVGGWVARGEDQCPQDFNAIRFARYGAETRLPMLWLYGSSDLIYGSDDTVRSYAKAFTAAGGSAHFQLISGIAESGHWLPRYLHKWSRQVDEYLSSLKYP